jgi:hypothetical protein
MVRFMISLIAHDNIRYTAEGKFDDAIRYANSRKDLGLDERNEMILRICATMCGNLTAYVDQFKGLAHQLKVGELVDLTKKYYKDSYNKADEIVERTEEEETQLLLNSTHIQFVETGQMLGTYEESFDPEPGFVSTLRIDEGENVEEDTTYGATDE